jgi:hypothetical protein
MDWPSVHTVKSLPALRDVPPDEYRQRVADLIGESRRRDGGNAKTIRSPASRRS